MIVRLRHKFAEPTESGLQARPLLFNGLRAILAKLCHNCDRLFRLLFAYATSAESNTVLGNLVRTESVIAFLRRKWDRELGYRLRKELWGFRENRMAVTFFYEWHDDSGQWYRSYGNELWEFAPSGLMVRRIASINDAPIHESDRQLRQ